MSAKERERRRGTAHSGKTYETTVEGEKRGGRFFFYLPLLVGDTRLKPRGEKKGLPQISVSLYSAGTSSQAKTKSRRLTMFMFCLLAKDDFNTNTQLLP